MKTSDLFQLFIALPPEDRRALRKFVHSPFHNLRDDVTALFDFLDKNAEKNLDGLTKEAAHEAAFPGQPFNGRQLRYLMNYLLKVIEQYLSVREMTADMVQSDIYLANAYRKLGLEKHTRQTLESIARHQEKSPHRDVTFYEQNYLLEAETFAFSEGMKRTAPRNLQELSYSLDLAFLAKKLRQSCVALSHQAVANVEYEAGLLPLVLDYLEDKTLLDDHPAIALYFYYYRAATTADDRYFEKLKTGIFRQGNIFSEEELRNLYLLAINFGIQRFNKGELRYLNEVFDLYKEALQQEILLENGQLSRFAFKNIAGIAIRLKAYTWTEGFIKKYGPAVEERHRQNYTSFNLARLYYARRDFQKAMSMLQTVEYEDVFLSLDARVLLMKIYFELGESALLDSFITSFQRFLYRKKELGYHRENYLNTLQFTCRLLAVSPFDKQEKEKLKSEIEQEKILGEREWLMERLL